MTRGQTRAPVPDKLARLIGKRARAARTATGWTQTEVAQRVEMASQVYGRLERGDMRPSIETFRNLILVLGIPAEELLGIHQERRANTRRSRRRESHPWVQQLIRHVRELDAERVRLLVKLARALVQVRRK